MRHLLSFGCFSSSESSGVFAGDGIAAAASASSSIAASVAFLGSGLGSRSFICIARSSLRCSSSRVSAFMKRTPSGFGDQRKSYGYGGYNRGYSSKYYNRRY